MPPSTHELVKATIETWRSKTSWPKEIERPHG
jgi:hypothetical protein